MSKTTRQPQLVFSGAEADLTTVTIKPNSTYESTAQRIVIGEAQAGTTCSVILTATVGSVTVTHVEATLSGTTFAHIINGPLETVQFRKNGGGTLKLIAVI